MNGVTKLTVTEDVALVTFHRVDAGLRFISRVFSDFSNAGINIDMISQTAPTGDFLSVSFTVPGADLVQVLAITNRYRADSPEVQPLVSSGNCKLQLFGAEMPHTPGVAARAISAVSAAQAHVLMITTSEVDISLLLADYNLEHVITLLSESFSVEAQR